MAGKPVDLPTGVEIFRNSLRVRFTWNGRRHSETLQFPVTPKGIQAASRLRTKVVATYAEHFPTSSKASDVDSFGGYAQLWLDSRGMTKGTRNNYLSLYWQPHLAKTRLDLITTTRLRQIITETEWNSPAVKRNAIVRLSTVLKPAVSDGLLTKNPAEAIELPRRSRKEVAPFTQAEADRIIAAMYRKHVRVFRVVALGEVEESTKTHKSRTVLLNHRAIHALEFAKAYAERRKTSESRVKMTPFVFPPSKNSEYVKQTSDIHHQWRPTLKALGIRYRRPYNCRHTYATMCLMSGMNPAFIAQQLGNTVQMLLSTYAHWINSGSDWSEIAKLEIGIKSVSG